MAAVADRRSQREAKPYDNLFFSLINQSICPKNVNTIITFRKYSGLSRLTVKERAVIDRKRVGKAGIDLVLSGKREEIKCQNKIKFRSDLPTQFFLAMLPETDYFFSLALNVQMIEQ